MNGARLALALCLGGCAGPAPTDPSTPSTETDPADRLSSLGLLAWDGEAFSYSDGVVPYTLATPLFSDFAVKDRAMQLPAGTSATWDGDGVLTFPVGTRLVKSFRFPLDLRDPAGPTRLVETRVLTLEDDGWDAWPYLWDEDATDAVKAPSGDVTDVSLTGFDGEALTFAYLVPERNQCVDCHEKSVGADDSHENTPIGPSPRNLNHGGQLEALVDAGIVTGLPPLDTIGAATDAATLAGVDPATLPDEVLFPAARDYLDVNCAHCHDPAAGEGRSSQLFLDWDEQDPFHLGVCKRPGSAGKGTGGLTFDIVPGAPEQSILWYRIHTRELGEMMPDLGRALVDDQGVALVAEWIARLDGACSE